MAGGRIFDVWQVTDDQRDLYAVKVFRLNHTEDLKIKVCFSPTKYGYTTHLPTRGIIRGSQRGSG